MYSYKKILKSLTAVSYLYNKNIYNDNMSKLICISNKVIIKNIIMLVKKEILHRISIKRKTCVFIICNISINKLPSYIIKKFLSRYDLRIKIFCINYHCNVYYDVNLERCIIINKLLDIQKIATCLVKYNPKFIIDIISNLYHYNIFNQLNYNIIDFINKYKICNKVSIVSINLPSSLSFNVYEKEYSSIIFSDITISFVGLHLLHVLELNMIYVGQVLCFRVGNVFHNDKQIKIFNIMQDNYILNDIFKSISNYQHKGSFGYLSILAGDMNTIGACKLSMLAGLKSGIGNIILVVSNNNEYYSYYKSEIVKFHIQDFLKHAISKKINAFIFGPGLGKSILKQKDVKILFSFAANNNIPMIIDAEALFVLKLFGLNFNNCNIIATPHPGEAAKLLNINVSCILHNKIMAMHNLINMKINQVSNIVWLLKGSCPIIGMKGMPLFIYEGLVSSLSIAGSGDVLSGMIGALLAQSYSLMDSCLLAVNTHLSIGKVLNKKYKRGHLASDIANCIPSILFNKN